MKSLISRILIGMLLISSQAQILASSGCIKPIRELLRDGTARHLQPGEKVWGNYMCSSCGTENSMKPNRLGDVRCETCGVAHTTEPDYPPAFFKKDGEIYLLDRKALVGYEDGKFQGHGLRDNCPFCTTGHFANMDSCISCGAELLNADDAFRGIPPLRGSTSSAALNVNPTPVRTSNYVAQEVTNQSRPVRFGREAAELEEKEKITQRIPLSRNQMLAIGATGSVFAITAGVAGYQRAMETYTATATVTKIENGTVWVTYHIDGEEFTIDLTYDQGKATSWRMGERVEIYLVHWKGPQGAERSNGEVYPVNE